MSVKWIQMVEKKKKLERILRRVNLAATDPSSNDRMHLANEKEV